MTVSVGYSCQVVDVPLGTPMAGFAARTGASLGVHDPLTVRALIIDHVGIVTIDCCVLHERTCEQIRQSSVLDDVVVCATHTHSGASIGWDRVGEFSAEVHQQVIDATRVALEEADHNRHQCVSEYAEVFGLGIAKNRRDPSQIIDPPAQAVRFIDADTHQVHVIWVTYPCHPVVLDGTNRLISADYIGYLRDRLEQNTPATMCLFTTGAAGEVNTGHRPEDSFSPDGKGKRTFAEAQRIGHSIADALIAAPWRNLHIDTSHAVFAKVSAQIEQLSESAVRQDKQTWISQLAQANPELGELLKIWIAWADQWLTPQQPRPTSWCGRVGMIRLGCLRIVTLPGEPFWAGAQQLLESRNDPTIVIGYSDGVPGYFPTADQYRYGGYEVVDAHRYYDMPGPFKAGSAERILDIAAHLLDT